MKSSGTYSRSTISDSDLTFPLPGTASFGDREVYSYTLHLDNLISGSVFLLEMDGI